MRVCVLWIINVNQYGAMLSTQAEKKGQQTCHKNSQSFLRFLQDDIKTYYNISLSQRIWLWFPAMIRLEFVTWCWLLFIIQEIIQELNWHLHSDPLKQCPCDWLLFSYQTPPPPRSFSLILTVPVGPIRRSFTLSLALNGDFCILDLYDHYC